jgi:hypothetical protein
VSNESEPSCPIKAMESSRRTCCFLPTNCLALLRNRKVDPRIVSIRRRGPLLGSAPSPPAPSVSVELACAELLSETISGVVFGSRRLVRMFRKERLSPIIQGNQGLYLVKREPRDGPTIIATMAAAWSLKNTIDLLLLTRSHGQVWVGG